MNKIQIFQNEQFGKVRIAMNENEEPLFCLADVAKALGYNRPADAVSQHCKGVVILPTPTNGGVQEMKYGKESEVYRLTMKSKLPDAEKFQDWFADAVSTSQRSCLVAELAKILQQNGVNIGQNRLFAWMRENGYLCSKGQYYNQPTQKAMDLGLFELKQTTINKPDGSILVSTTTKVTGKGQVYFVNKFLGKDAA